MKVLHIIPSISYLRGGPSTAVIAMVKALREQGIDASILTTNDHGPGLHPELSTGHWVEYQGLPVLAFPRWSPSVRILREFIFSPQLSWWLHHHIHQFDLLHVHAVFSYASTASMLQARYSNIPYILRTIGQLGPWSLRQSAFRKKIMLQLIEKSNIDSAAALHFTSEQERTEASQIISVNRSFVLPLGVDIPQVPFTRPPTSCCTKFLFLSRIHPKKQLHILLQAFAIVKANYPALQWILQIAGDCDNQDYLLKLNQMISNSNLTEHCKWMGFITGPSKWKLLYDSDWFILPSASENFGIAVAEALSVGTPAIVAPQVAISDLIRKYDAGFVCPSTPELLAEAITLAINTPTNKYHTSAIRLVQENYSWHTISTILSTYYNRIMVNRCN